MAKKLKSQLIRLKCAECGHINYTTTKGLALKDKLALSKFCNNKTCKKHTTHNEVKIK
jgi:ribosomal protein L33